MTHDDWTDIRPARGKLVSRVLRAAGAAAVDVTRRRSTDATKVPPRPAALTPQWLGAVLGEDVVSLRYDTVSSGTSERGRIVYSLRDGVERRLFVKATPTLMMRIANGLTGTSGNEALFFNELRAALGDVEIPHGRYSAADPRSLRSIHLLEDLVWTRGATFPGPGEQLNRQLLESAVDLLACLHRTFRDIDHPRIPSYAEWWRANLQVADVRKAVLRLADDSVCPPELRSGARLWSLASSSIAMHVDADRTLLHGDPHPGNWFIAHDRLGLLDWQCVAAGHWSRDLAYALTTILSVEQRRQLEDDLLLRYRESAGHSESMDEVRDLYRRQLAGGLLMWAPTLHRPRGFPEMQPASLAREMLHRVLTAMSDHMNAEGNR